MEPVLMACISTAMVTVTKGVADGAMAQVSSRLGAFWREHFGFEPTIESAEVDAVAELTESDELPDELRVQLGGSALARRLTRSAALLNGMRILWVDDNPHWNSWEIASLEAMGISVRTVESTRTMLSFLPEDFDLLLSDISRGDERDAGIAALPQVRKMAPTLPIVFYVGDESRGVPAGAFGLTARPSELLHLVVDVAERTRL